MAYGADIYYTYSHTDFPIADYAVNDEGVPIKECPMCTSSRCYRETVADDYHDHTNYRCVNCDTIIKEDY
jgi:hypothetical protein